MEYSALIRTFNSAQSIAATVDALADQTSPPQRFVIVDSGSTDATLSLLPAGSMVVRYAGERFNYSSALNQGIAHLDTSYTLIISSHTVLGNPDAMAYAIALLAANPGLGAAYFMPSPSGSLTYSAIDASNFTGFNGVFNTCAVFRTALLAQRPFRPEVFSAEDQEWSRWLIESQGLAIARITGGGMQYRNPLTDRRDKHLREQVAVAIYAKPDMLRAPYLARVCYRMLRPTAPFADRVANARLLGTLVYYRLTRSLPPNFN